MHKYMHEYGPVPESREAEARKLFPYKAPYLIRPKQGIFLHRGCSVHVPRRAPVR